MLAVNKIMVIQRVLLAYISTCISVDRHEQRSGEPHPGEHRTFGHKVCILYHTICYNIITQTTIDINLSHFLIINFNLKKKL